MLAYLAYGAAFVATRLARCAAFDATRLARCAGTSSGAGLRSPLGDFGTKSRA